MAFDGKEFSIGNTTITFIRLAGGEPWPTAAIPCGESLVQL